jgi:formylmethanofuran dehydrogenase subunit E
MRAGKRAMHELGVSRGGATHAIVHGGDFFAQGVEAVTGCSALYGNMEFEEKAKSITDWYVCLQADGKQVELRIKDRLFAGADEVLSLADEDLLESVMTTGVVPRG